MSAIALQHETWPIERLAPYENNPRINDHVVEKMAANIREFGFRIPIVAMSSGELVDGHLRLKAAQFLGLTEVPVVLADDLSEEQVRAFRLAVNRAAELADWDPEKVLAELEALSGADINLDLLGFDTSFLAELEAQLAANAAADAPPALTDPDEVPEVPVVPISVLGDIWILGNHRIVCGDSTKAETVKACLSGAKPHLMVTDPPYGVKYDATWRGKAGHAGLGKNRTGIVQNDDRADWREVWALFPGSIAYVWHGGLMSGVVADSLTSCEFTLRSQIIWNKTVMAMGRGDYHWKHEPCQPAGTMVQKVIKPGRWREHSTIESVPIETLVEGDMVVSFGEAKIFRRGRRVNGISCRQYVGNMHTVAAGELQTSATAEHQFTIRFDPTKAKSSVVYLMRRGERWRIGVCGLFNSRGFGPAVRLSQERGEELWIVSAHPDLMAARVAEQVASCIYGIPTTHWETGRNPGGLGFRTCVEIENIYRQIGTERIASGVARLFDEFGLQLDHPLVLSDDIGRFSRRQSRIVRACNLVPGIMQLPIPTKGEDFEWRSITSAQFEPFEGPVWSMEVDQDQHYVADGIVTHNCWYAVRKGKPGKYVGGRKQTTVWDIDKPRKSETGHGTQKPVECMQRPIENNSQAGDAIYEPFSGSGTTIVAGEITGRRVFAIELSPAYVDLAVLRWQGFTGRIAVHADTGKSFTDMSVERISSGTESA